MQDEQLEDDQPKKETETIETLVGKAAETKKESDIDKLFLSLKGRELYLKTCKEDKNQIPIMKVNDDLAAFILYTSPDDERLTSIYGGTIWESALHMLLNMASVDALLIQSSTTEAYVCVMKEKAGTLFLAAQRKSMSVTY